MSVVIMDGRIESLGWNGQLQQDGSKACIGTSTYKPVNASLAQLQNKYEGQTLAYFEKRPPQAERDSGFALAYVKANASTPDAQQAALAALEFKCDVLWAMLDALHHAYVAPKHVPPGAFEPKE